MTAADVAEVCHQQVAGPAKGPAEVAPGCERTFHGDGIDIGFVLVDFKTSESTAAAFDQLRKRIMHDQPDPPDKLRALHAQGIDAAYGEFQTEHDTIASILHVAKGRWGLTLTQRVPRGSTLLPPSGCRATDLEELAMRAAARLP